jgi:hypothetical protein
MRVPQIFPFTAFSVMQHLYHNETKDASTFFAPGDEKSSFYD